MNTADLCREDKKLFNMAWHNGDYPTITSLTDADILLGAQSGSSAVFTGATLKSYISAKSSNLLNSDSTLLGTDANTSEKVLFSYTLPAATLSVDGWFVHIIVWGSVLGDANNKRIILRTGTPATIINSGAAAVDNQWILESWIIRLAAGNQDCYSRIYAFSNPTWGDPVTGMMRKFESTENLNSAITFDFVGQNSAAIASSVVYEGSIILLNA